MAPRLLSGMTLAISIGVKLFKGRNMKPMAIIALFAFILADPIAAAEFEDSIHSIQRGSEGEPHLVKFHSGAVEFVEQNQKSKLKNFEERLKSTKSNVQSKSFSFEESDFEPTPVPDSAIKEIFKQFNPYMKRKSECSDRAHVWAWDEHQRSGIKSEKAFLMLTDSYIKRHRYKWWFHVAPLFTTTSGKKIVMDNQFLDQPVEFSTWKNLLVFSKRECVTDFRFLDYNAGADQTQDCYVKFEPMYSYVPGDIGARESGSPKTDWSASLVNSARFRSFFQGSLK